MLVYSGFVIGFILSHTKACLNVCTIHV